MRAALADAGVQPDLSTLRIHYTDLCVPDAVDALADAVCARQRLRELELYRCGLSPAATPALVRALSHGALTRLMLMEVAFDFLDAAGGETLGAALRANTTLTSLGFYSARKMCALALAALLGGLGGHRSLRRLYLVDTKVEDAGTVGVALAALIAADTLSLKKLHARRCSLGEDGLGPLLDALHSNTHLQCLIVDGNNPPAGFMRSRLLPAVLANTGLGKLMVDKGGCLVDDNVAAVEAMNIVATR